jgi:rhodanese-related sulfurtransferase
VSVPQISVEELAHRLRRGEPTLLVDVRQHWEHELAALRGSQLIPLPELASRLSEVQPPEGALVVVYCHHGVRSLSGASLLEPLGAVSLAGGIDAWSLRVDPRVPRY